MLLSYASWAFRARAFRPIFGAPADQPWLSNSPLDAIYVIRNDAVQDIADIVSIQAQERSQALVIGEVGRTLIVPQQVRSIAVDKPESYVVGERQGIISAIRHDALQWAGERAVMQVFYDASALELTREEYDAIAPENIRLIEVAKENRTILVDSVERAAIIA